MKRNDPRKTPAEINLEKQERKWYYQKEIKERKRKLFTDKIKTFFSFIPKISTSKKLIWFLFLNCTIIEVFTGYVILKNLELAAFTGMPPDLSPLVALIGAVVGEVIGYGVYSAKATKENIKDGISYELAMKELNEGISELTQEEYPIAKG